MVSIAPSYSFFIVFKSLRGPPLVIQITRSAAEGAPPLVCIHVYIYVLYICISAICIHASSFSAVCSSSRGYPGPLLLETATTALRGRGRIYVASRFRPRHQEKWKKNKEEKKRKEMKTESILVHGLNIKKLLKTNGFLMFLVTSNNQKTTNNKQRTTNNKQQTAKNKQQTTTNNKQQQQQ